MARRQQRERKKAKRRTVDFSGVEAGGRRKIPQGDYLFTITEISEEEGDAGVYWRVISEIKSGKHKGFKDFSNYSFSKKALWKIRQLLEALGLDVPTGKMSLDPNELLGGEFGGGVEDDTYQGKVRSRVVDVFPPDELEDGEDDDEEEDGDETEDEDEEDDDEEVDDEEDEEDEDEEEEEKPKPRRKKRSKR